MPVSPESAIQQLRDAFPNKYRYYTDEQVYREAREKYPDAPIQDWDKINYKTVTTPKKDPADVYLNQTDEDSFMDKFNLYGIDEDSSYLARLAYSRSLQGMVDDLSRGKPKFTFDKQPAIWEEAVAGIMAFGMPLDALSLFGGGSIVGKAAVSALAKKGATKYLSKQVVKKIPGLAKAPGGRAAVESSIRNIIGSEMMYVPYEGMKGNMYARTQHIRDPENFPQPLSDADIRKETFASIVHGGIMGVMASATRPFLAARHARMLKTVDNMELQKKLTGASQKRLLNLKSKMKYTGQLGQYATDVAGLTLGDITGTAVAYGQLKSAEEMMASLLTMGGFAGATRLAGIGLQRTVAEPLEKAQKIYNQKWEERKKYLEKEEAIQNSINAKSADQFDSDAEIQAKQSSFDDTISDIDSRRQAWEESPEYKEYLEILDEMEAFEKNNSRKIKEGKPISAKEAIEFYEKRMATFSNVRNYFDEAGEMFDDVERLDKWMEQGNENALKSLTAEKTDLSDKKIRLLDRLEAEGPTLKMDVTGPDKIKRAQDIDINEVENVFRKENPNLSDSQILEETVNFLDMRLKEKLGTKVAKPVDDANVNRVIEDLNQTSDQLEAQIKRRSDEMRKDPEGPAEDILLNLKEADKIRSEIDIEIEKLDDLNLTDSEKNMARQNLLMAQTFITDILPEYQVKSGAAAGTILGPGGVKEYAKGVLDIITNMIKDGDDSFLGNIKGSSLENYASKLTGKPKLGLVSFYRFLESQGLANPSVKKSLTTLYKSDPQIKAPLGIGMESKAFEFKTDGTIKVSYPMGKTKGKRVAGIIASKIKATIGEKLSYSRLMKSVLKIAKKNKIQGEDALKQVKQFIVPFFAKSRTNLSDKLTNKVIGEKTFKQLSQSIFGVTGKTYRKGFSTWVESNYGIESKQFILVDKFGVGHKLAKYGEETKAYVDGLKMDKNTGLPKNPKAFKELQTLQNKYQKLIFNSKKSSQLEKMSDAQLKKYGLAKGALDYAEGISIYQLKKGYENLNNIAKNADKQGYIYFSKDGKIITDSKSKSVKMAIHKNVLEGLFRTFSETSARITDIVAKVDNKRKMPITDSGVFISKSLESLAKKTGFNIKSGAGLDDVDFNTLQTKPGDKFKKSALTKNSADDINSLKAKAKILITGGRHGDFSRANLGNKKYESNLKLILKHYGMTDMDIKKMKKISLDDDMVDEGVVSRILDDMECK